MSDEESREEFLKTLLGKITIYPQRIISYAPIDLDSIEDRVQILEELLRDTSCVSEDSEIQKSKQETNEDSLHILLNRMDCIAEKIAKLNEEETAVKLFVEEEALPLLMMTEKKISMVKKIIHK